MCGMWCFHCYGGADSFCFEKFYPTEQLLFWVENFLAWYVVVMAIFKLRMYRTKKISCQRVYNFNEEREGF